MYDSYLICTAPRSGSTLLCRMLTATGVAGAPGSFFHGQTLSDWAVVLDLTLDEAMLERAQIQQVFDAAIAKGRGGGALFGTRVQGHSFPAFKAQLRRLHPDQPSDAARVAAAFGKTAFLHLTRGDKLAQAVSVVRAEQSGLWHRRADGSELERLSEPQEPRFDPEAIGAQMRKFEAIDMAWRDWFEAESITPLVITYESLAEEPQGNLTKALAHIGCDPELAKDVAPDVTRLSDDINAEWITRYRANFL